MEIPQSLRDDLNALDAVMASVRKGTYVQPSAEEFARSQIRHAKSTLAQVRRIRRDNAEMWGLPTDQVYIVGALNWAAKRRQLAADALAKAAAERSFVSPSQTQEAA